jgi:hypothetical protein
MVAAGEVRKGHRSENARRLPNKLLRYPSSRYPERSEFQVSLIVRGNSACYFRADPNMNRSDASSPPLTRRRLLALGGTVTLGGVACYLGWPENSEGPANSAAGNTHQSGNDPVVAKYQALEESETPGEYSRKRFTPHVGSDFELSAVNTVCRLEDVGDIFASSGPAGDFGSFSLMFSAPAGSPVESAIHTLKHPVLGEFDLFLSPVGPGDEKLFLEAVCCRRV